MATAAYEVKHTRGSERFKMSELKEHQRACLLAANNKTGFVFKIPDTGMSFLPFDMFVLKHTPAWVVIVYPKIFVLINIKKLCKWREPSLHVNDAMLMAAHVGAIADL
jgi:hypothetical protein